MCCDVGEVTESLENELCCMSLYLYIYELCSFSKISVTSPTYKLITKPSVALPMSQLILQPFRCFTYVTAHSPTLLSLLLRHRLFTYVTWRAARALKIELNVRCFRVLQHQRSLAPVMNVFLWLRWPMISGDGWGQSFPEICLMVEEKPRKNPTRKTDPTRDRNLNKTWLLLFYTEMKCLYWKMDYWKWKTLFLSRFVILT